jgi:2-amino-4-hydroxy-6-hydroxymethyldihydropteridine diphosphokinase
MAKHLAYIGVGTNIAPRSERMKEAFDALEAKWQVLAKSSIYLTKPVGFTDQPEFLNAVVGIICEQEPKELFRELKLLESSLGRVTRERWHEREIDFDILFFDNINFNDEVLDIPHPEALRRNFVLIPLVEVAPSLVDPSSGKHIATFLMQVGIDPDSIRMLSAGELID